MAREKPVDVLLVEDNEDDIFITTESMERAKPHMTLHIVRDGVEALRYLRREGPYPDAVIPDPILLDLDMPRMMDYDTALF